MVVDRFSDTIIENPKLNENAALVEWNKKGELPGVKFMRTLAEPSAFDCSTVRICGRIESSCRAASTARRRC
jgi:hypothetical protein